MIASVSGMRKLTVVPSPSTEAMSMTPPSLVMLVLTTSMPTPRPDRLLTSAAVEKPGANTSRTRLLSGIAAISSSVIMPFSTAFRPTRWGSMPRPSSMISTTT